MDSGDDSSLWSFMDDPNGGYTDDPGGDPNNGGYVNMPPDQIDPITSDPSLGMMTPPQDTNGMDPTFNPEGGGIAGMTAAQIAQLASKMGMSPAQLTSALGQMATGAGGSSFLDGLGKLLNTAGNALGLGGGGEGAAPMSLILPYIAQAYKQYQDAGKYTDVGKQAAAIDNPMGDRSQYVNLLSQSYTDPQKVLDEDPSFKFLEQQGLAGLAQTQAASGNMAFNTAGQPSGGYAKDIMDYNQGLASTTLNNYRAGLQPLAGAGFNPSAAGNAIIQGNQLAIQSQNNAMANIGGALNAARGGTTTTPTAPPNLDEITAPPSNSMVTPPVDPNNPYGMTSPPVAPPPLYGNPQAGT